MKVHSASRRSLHGLVPRPLSFMPVIKPTCVRDLKLRVSLTDVVGRVATLRKAGGSRWKALCPFHNEKTPSFHLNTDKGLYHCFGCGKSGDVIDFVQATEQLNFAEAVEALGQRFNLVIEYEEGRGAPTAEQRSLRQELYQLHDAAAEYYHQAFLARDATGGFFQDYWTAARKFPLELAKEFKVGAVDAGGGALAALLCRQKYSDEALRRCGLFFAREDGPVSPATLRPRFRGRLMIPIRDHQGRIVAFTARQTTLTPEDDPARDAKYVNSPETPIFTKGNLLFNLDRAREAAGKGEPFVLVEGQLDAMRCWSVGLKTAVAPQGTAITESQLLLLRRYQSRVECLFDSDGAGQKAALRFLPMALRAELEVRFLALGGSEKLDPDLLFLEQGLAGYAKLQAGALSAMRFACQALLPEPAAASAEQKTRAAHAAFAIIAAAESEMARAQFVAEVAALLRLPAAAVAADFARHRARQARPGPGGADHPAPAPAPAGPRAVTPEHHLLMLCLHFENLLGPLSAALPHGWVDTTHPAGILLSRFFEEFAQGNWPGRDHLDPLLESAEERELVASLLFTAPELDDPFKVAVSGLEKLRTRALGPRLRQIELALATHPADINHDPISLLKERSELQRQLRQPMGLSATA